VIGLPSCILPLKPFFFCLAGCFCLLPYDADLMKHGKGKAGGSRLLPVRNVLKGRCASTRRRRSVSLIRALYLRLVDQSSSAPFELMVKGIVFAGDPEFRGGTSVIPAAIWGALVLLGANGYPQTYQLSPYHGRIFRIAAIAFAVDPERFGSKE
jgi:hypothetical protein